MSRKIITLAASLIFALGANLNTASADTYVKTELPASIDSCFKQSLAGIFDIGSSDKAALFDYFLANIAVDQFGAYNFKRAWRDWAEEPELQRLALYQYFDLMAQKRSEHGGATAGIDARLADQPVVSGDNMYHIVARVNFSDGSSASIVVLSAGCKAFGFMYGGADLRGLVDVNLIEKMYRDGARAPS